MALSSLVMVVVVVVISKVMAYVYMLVHVLKYLLAGCCIFFVGVVIGTRC